MADLLVVGTGLIGTSIALAVPEHWDVVLSDSSGAALGEAVARGAGRGWDGRERCRIAVVATPPRQTAIELVRLLDRDVTVSVTHVCSVQSEVEQELTGAARDVSSVCGGHPMAGRELSGPSAARADLFVGRPWVVCPSPSTTPTAAGAVRELAEACGAVPVQMSADEHDAVVALVSHLPQVTASALAARLVDPDEVTAAAATSMAGPGLADTTRLAASDAALWQQVLSLNATRVAPLVRAVAQDLLDVAAALEQGAGEPVASLLLRGNAGRALVPVKRGRADQDFRTVSVSVSDRPGELARLLNDTADSGVNVEDVRVEHIPGRPRGVIALLLPSEGRDTAGRHLAELGWQVVEPAP